MSCAAKDGFNSTGGKEGREEVREGEMEERVGGREWERRRV